MDLFTYLMAKKGHNTHRDLFSYLLGKGTGGSGTYTTFSGTSLNISNTLQAKIKNIALKGNTSQDGTPTPDTPIPIKVVTGEQNVEISGTNMIDESVLLSSLTYNSETGYYSGTPSSAINSTTSGIFKENTRYTAKWLAYTTSTASVKESLQIKFNYTDGTETHFNTTSAITPTEHSYTSASGKTVSSFQIIYVRARNINIKDLMLYEGTNTTQPYVPYQKQNYPISLSSKNLFDKDSIVEREGYLNADGEYMSSNASSYTTNFTSVKPNTTYTIQGTFKNNVSSDLWGIYFYNQNQEWISKESLKVMTPYTFTTPNNCYYLQLQHRTDISVTFGSDVMIEENSIATTYEPYYNLELAKIGDYKDYIFKNVVGSPYYNADLDLNGWYKYKAMNKYTFTGNEGVSVTGDVFYTNDIADNILTGGIICICNRMKAVENTSTGSNLLINTCCFRPGNYSRFYFNMSSITTVASEIKQYLSENNTYVIYPLATPTYEKITDTTLIQQLENINNNARSYKGTTIIECTSESTDNETIGFSGDIKVTSVGNSLNTRLLSNEKPNLNEIEDIEQNDELIENEEIEEKVS